MLIGFWGAQENKHDQTIQFAEIFGTNVMQIVPGVSLLKSQVAIISLSTLYCESAVKMKSQWFYDY